VKAAPNQNKIVLLVIIVHKALPHHLHVLEHNIRMQPVKALVKHVMIRVRAVSILVDKKSVESIGE